MPSTLVASAKYRFGRVMRDAALVPADLIGGVSGQRGGYRFRVSTEAALRGADDQLEHATTVWCHVLLVECAVEGERAELDAAEALAINHEIARDVFMALVFRNPTLGFPGLPPERESHSVTVDGARIHVNSGDLLEPYRVMLINSDVVTLEELQRAAAGERRPSRARVMVAEASHQVLYNPRASKVTAVVVAASACEIAIHECVRRLASAPMDRLVGALIPVDGQAKLSPSEVVDRVIPALGGPRLADENGHLWATVKELFKARNKGVHRGSLPEGADAEALVRSAQRFIGWLESTTH